jgi:myo-inositol 2-dehydrogenase/D-chiro-inositol 1-dehydrogenase
MTNLRIGVVGTGAMGLDHVRRLETAISGAEVSAVIEPDEARAAAALKTAPQARAFARTEDAADAGAVDALIVATPGFLHENVLLPGLDARLPMLCEKPLTPDPESAWRVLEAEMATGQRLIQVGFMRRFDRDHRQLRDLVRAGDAGLLLMLHCAHRNPAVPDSYLQEMLVNDSLVHEFDSVPWLAGSDIATIEVRYPRRNSLAPDRLAEPIIALLELDNGVLADVEMNVNDQFGYQVTTEAVFEQGVTRLGEPAGLRHWLAGRSYVAEHAGFATRFADAYDTQVQRWVSAAQAGGIAGPSAWDGFKVAVACQVGVEALQSGGIRELKLPTEPEFYVARETE